MLLYGNGRPQEPMLCLWVSLVLYLLQSLAVLMTAAGSKNRLHLLF